MVKIGSFWGQKWRHKSKFWEIGQKNFSLKVSKNYLIQVYGHIFGRKCHCVISQNLGKLVKNFLLYMFLRIILVKFMDINLVKNDINGVNLVKIDHFWWKWSKSGHFDIFWAPKRRHMSTFGEIGQTIFSLKVSKNNFSQVYGQKSGQKCH